jgi:two-component system nitrogen regulation sensor histidine kinase NtrY
MRNSLYYYYLIAALLCLAITVFLGSPFSVNLLSNQIVTANSNKIFLQKIATTLQKELTITETHLQEVKTLVATQKNINFTQLSYEEKYPTYIYNDEQLLYWTDYKYFIDLEEIAGKFKYRCIENANGFFLLNKEVVIIDSMRYQLVTAVPLYLRYKIDNQYVKSHYNREIFDVEDNIFSLSLNDEEGEPIKSSEGRYLFSVVLEENDTPATSNLRKNFTILFAGLTVLFSMLLIRLNVLDYLAEHKYWQAFFVLVIALFFLRILISFLDFPLHFRQYETFNFIDFLKNLVFAPTLLDFFLNMVVVAAFSAFIFRYYYKLLNIKLLIHTSISTKIFISILLCLLTYMMSTYQFYVFEAVYYQAQISLDLMHDLDFNQQKFLCLAAFVLSAVVYFFICNIVSRLLIAFNQTNFRIGISLVYASVIYVLFFVILDAFELTIFIINVLYLSLITFLRFSRAIRAFGYNTYLYLFLSSVASAALGAYSIYNFEGIMDLYNKKDFGAKLLVENDKLGEFLLQDAGKKIQEDAMIQARMLLSTSGDLVSQKVKKFYMSDYFDKYDVNVLLFSGNGEPLNSEMTFDSLYQKYALEKYKTEYQDVFFIADLVNNTKRYLQFLPIERQGTQVGRIVLDLKLKKIIPNSVYPSLFIDKRFAVYNQDVKYSYAMYRHTEQEYTFGDFSYTKDFLKYFEEAKKIAGAAKKEIRTEDKDSEKTYRHILMNGQDGKSVVVSSEIYPFRHIVSNFSYLFIVLLFSNLLASLVLSLVLNRMTLVLSYASRIQIYLNLAFFLPLALVSIVVVSILNQVNIDETKDSYIEKAENVSTNLGASLENLKKGSINREKLLDPLIEVAKLTQTDINVFSKTGRLLAASQPFIYENGFLSEIINPQAIAKIIEQKQNKVMLTESIGNLLYNSVYVGVKSYETGEILGIIGIPFFESQRKSEQQIVVILSTIMNVFTFTFMGLLFLSYFASRVLTKPLQLITQKIKRTSLSGNEPLEYNAADEIGLLVNAYNQMLVQLDESKEALSRTEKEAAWREMARQVAHEIKNPLTPMKLKLQHLQRVVGVEKPNLADSIGALLAQIDTVSDIATSFAAFANMPIPKNEEFDIGAVLRETVNLYENNEKAQISLNIPAGTYLVMGDSKLMSRIFTNLIINGIQAVTEEKTPMIQVNLTTLNKEKVIVEVRDNGAGIPMDIQQRVFLPNFTTKNTGSGIGLAVAKRGIEHAKGTIWFETEENVGTSFFIEMPLR